ncbi:hypothetical protein ACFLYR_04905 [Chloroflexota bacterium]
MTYFVGDGDDHYGDHIYGIDDEDYIQLNSIYLEDAINPRWNVLNSKSSVAGIGTGKGEGVDIDTYDVSSYIGEGDTSTTLQVDSGAGSWDIVYFLPLLPH